MLEFEICRAGLAEGQIGVMWGRARQAGILGHKLEPTGRLESTSARTASDPDDVGILYPTHLAQEAKSLKGDRGELASEVNPSEL